MSVPSLHLIPNYYHHLCFAQICPLPRKWKDSLSQAPLWDIVWLLSIDVTLSTLYSVQRQFLPHKNTCKWLFSLSLCSLSLNHAVYVSMSRDRRGWLDLINPTMGRNWTRLCASYYKNKQTNKNHEGLCACLTETQSWIREKEHTHTRKWHRYIYRSKLTKWPQNQWMLSRYRVGRALQPCGIIGEGLAYKGSFTDRTKRRGQNYWKKREEK